MPLLLSSNIDYSCAPYWGSSSLLNDSSLQLLYSLVQFKFMTLDTQLRWLNRVFWPHKEWVRKMAQALNVPILMTKCRWGEKIETSPADFSNFLW